MAQIVLPLRTLSRRQLDKADVEQIYASIVQVIGGTYFVNGVSTGPVNGTIDWRNFAQGAGITNNQKANFSNVSCLQISDSIPNSTWAAFPSPTSFTITVPFSATDPAATLFEWSIAFKGAIPTAATWGLNYFRQDLNVPLASMNQGAFATDANGLSFARQALGTPLLVSPGDKFVLTITVTTAGAGSVTMHNTTLSFKTAHVK